MLKISSGIIILPISYKSIAIFSLSMSSFDISSFFASFIASEIFDFVVPLEIDGLYDFEIISTIE